MDPSERSSAAAAINKVAWRNVVIKTINEGLDIRSFDLAQKCGPWVGRGARYQFDLFGVHFCALATTCPDQNLSFVVAAEPRDPSYLSPLKNESQAYFTFTLQRPLRAADQAKGCRVKAYKSNDASGKHSVMKILAEGEPVPSPNGFNLQ